MKKIYTIIAIAVSCLVLTTCKKDKEPVPPVFEFNEVEAFDNSAEISGWYEYEGELKNLTLIYGKDSQLVDAENKDVDVEGKNFRVTVDDLEAETKYYYSIECKTTYSSMRTKTENFMTAKSASLPTVTTNEVTNITTNSAISGGSVTSDGNATVTARGVCWSTSQNPTINDNKTSDGTGTGSFNSNLLDLDPNTRYYVRAYATNEKGTSYGDEKSFTTLINEEVPTVTTNNVTNITINSATCGGNVTSDGNATVTARGVCWSTKQNPTINDNKTSDGTGTGSFNSNLLDLDPNIRYYVRAYATNEKGTSYGDEKSFTTLQNVELPTVTTTNVTNVTQTTATSGGNVTSDGNATVTARGVCWSTSQNPTINDNKTSDGTGTGSFNSNLLDLDPNTRYYVRAYATNEKGTTYGDEKSFTTLEKNPDINGHEYVDLGLPSGLKWAMCNVGANSPEDYGDYFAWGETTTKTDYSSSNCPTNGLSESELQSQGYIDGEGNLTPQHDAAAANWGGSWRMPTKAEQQELIDNCTWTWTTQSGVNGYKVKSTVNNNYIFLPAAGCRILSSLSVAGSRGHYWSSTPNVTHDNSAYHLHFLSDNHYMGYDYRYFGRSVRPVSE